MKLFSRIPAKHVLLALVLSVIAPMVVQAVESTPSESAEVSPPADTADDEKSKAHVTFAVEVPLNANCHDEFAVFPYPVTVPNIGRIDYQLPAGVDDLRNFIKQCVFYKWGKAENAPPDWRVDRAFKLALDSSRKHLPEISTGLDEWVDEFLPYFARAVRKINASEAIRWKRYKEADVVEAARQVYQDDAASKGLSAIVLNVRQIRPGIRETETVKLRLGNWYLVGTHSVPGLTYYWQQKVSLTGPYVRYIVLNEQNALWIKGHF